MAFDMDGTLTPLRVHAIPDFLLKELRKIPEGVKLTLCTGRPLYSLLGSLEKLGPERWDVIPENGNQIYTWNGKQYELLNEVNWPQKPSKESMAKHLTRAAFHVGQVRIRETQVTVSFYYLQWWPWLMTKCSQLVNRRIKKMLKKKGWDEMFKVQLSGIGNLVQTAEMHKGKAVQWWAKYHKIPLENLVCVGDNAQPGGNDEAMLNDTRWKGYTVGNPGSHAEPVMDKNGQPLQGPEGVQSLLNKLFKST